MTYCAHRFESFTLRKRGNLIRPGRAQVVVCEKCDFLKWVDPPKVKRSASNEVDVDARLTGTADDQRPDGDAIVEAYRRWRPSQA